MADKSLTRYLLANTDAGLARRAFEAAFLKHAGLGTLPTELLEEWLAQDTYYTRAYVRFIGETLAALQLPFSISTAQGKTLDFQILDVLLTALNGIHREMAFFESTSTHYGLQLTHNDVPPGPGTAAIKYQELFQATGNIAGHGGRDGLLYALVVLWATEHTYLTAWREARRAMDVSSASSEKNGAARALHEAFIPNWTSEEFTGFVSDCARIVDEVAEEVGVLEDPVKLERYRKVWETVLTIEEAFWPTLDSEM